jgi:hypothetical protein
MHKRRSRSDKDRKRPESRQALARAGGGRLKGVSHPIRDHEPLARAISAIGPSGLADAATKIGCHHTLLSRYLRGECKAITHTMVLKLLAAAAGVGPEVEADFMLALRPPEAQRRMDIYIELMQQCRSKHERALWRGVTRQQVERLFPALFDEFRQWMDRQTVPVRPVRQDLTIWRVIEPLFDGFETAWMEVGWQDFLIQDEQGKGKRQLIAFLKHRIESEKILLKVRGSDQLRAIRLAVAAEANDAFLKADPEDVNAAREHRASVYREQGIPPSYLLGIPAAGS